MHEPLLTQWIAEFLDLGADALVIDVGANLGWHAVHAAKHSNVETVVAFEPDRFNAWLLERNVAANGLRNVILDSRCVGARPGIARLYRYKSSNAGRHSLTADYGFGSSLMTMTDLDGALEDLGLGCRPVGLMKIDVEGYEPAVIAGASRTLERTTAVVLEHSPDWSDSGGISASDGLRRLSELNFVPFVLMSTGGIARTDFAALFEFKGSLDIIFLHAARMHELSPALRESIGMAPPLREVAERNKRMK
jgi:FkbM family methyltransferase